MFNVDSEKLGTTDREIAQAAEDFGTPLYLYNTDEILAAIEKLTTHCANFAIRYAVKTNPNPWLLSWLKESVPSLDVSSSGEISHALAAGWPGAALEFTGPAKTGEDLRLALEADVKSIVVEDLSEAVLLDRVAREMNKTARVLIRIAPQQAEAGFGVRLAGRPTQFGVDAEKLPDVLNRIRELNHISLDGFHIYSGSQCLDDEALALHFWNMWQLFQRAIGWWGEPVSELVFGAGMGIPYHEGDNRLTLSALKPVAEKIQSEIAALGYPVKSYIEVGRYLVGEAGLFVTRVVRVKESRNMEIAICDGGMNHNLGACGHLGGVSHRHYVMRALTEPNDDPAPRQYRVVGPLCTAIDTLAHRIQLPALREGDLLAVTCAGSYGPSASPLFFISHRQPREIVSVSRSGERQFIDITWLPGSESKR